MIWLASLERIQITDVPKISSIEIFNKQENINYLNLQQTGIINLNGISINNNSSEIFIENNINLENLDFTIKSPSKARQIFLVIYKSNLFLDGLIFLFLISAQGVKN